MSKAKPRFVAHSRTFMAVEALSRHEKSSTPFMRIEKGTKATITKGSEVKVEKKEDKKVDDKKVEKKVDKSE